MRIKGSEEYPLSLHNNNLPPFLSISLSLFLVTLTVPRFASVAYFTFQPDFQGNHFRETWRPIGRHVIGYWKRPISKFHYRFRATRIPQYLTTSIQDVTLVSDGFTSLFVFYSYISDSTRGRPRILETLHGKQRRVLPVLSPIPNFIYIYIFRWHKFFLSANGRNPRFPSDSDILILILGETQDID